MDDSESDDFTVLQKNTDELLRGIVANLPDNLRAEVLVSLSLDTIVAALSPEQLVRLQELLNKKLHDPAG